MKKCIILTAILLSTVFFAESSADVVGNVNKGKNAPSLTRRLPPPIPPPYLTPVPDTVKAADITTILITDNDRLYYQKEREEIAAFPSFNKTDYLADFFFIQYLADPDGYFRVIIHCHTSAGIFIHIVEQMHLFENKRREHALSILGIENNDINDIRRKDTSLYNRFMEISNRAFIWFEIWDEPLDINTSKLTFWGPTKDFKFQQDIDLSNLQSDSFNKLPIAIPSDSLRWGHVIKASIMDTNTILILYQDIDKEIVDGREWAIRKTKLSNCTLTDLPGMINYRRIKCPRCFPLLYINRKLDFEILWEIMDFLYMKHLRLLYFGVIPRSSYPPGTFPWTMQAVSLQIQYCLVQPTIVR